MLPEDIKEWREAQMSSVMDMRFWILTFSGSVIVIASLVAIYGLFRFKPWAPKLALAATAIGYLVWTLDVPTVQSGLGGALMSLSGCLWGAVLLQSYSGATAWRVEEPKE